MKYIFSILFKVLKILFFLIVVLYIGAYFYIKANKSKIIEQLTVQVSNKLNGKLSIVDADVSLFQQFPKIVIVLKNLSLTDSMYAQHKHIFFSAQQAFITLNIYKLIKKEQSLTGLSLKDAGIYFYTDTSGYTNTYLLKSKKDPAGGPKKTVDDINLKSIDLKNVRFVLDDRKREKLHDFDVKELNLKLKDGDSILKINAEANILINSLAFNLPNGTFLKGASFAGDFNFNYGKISQVLSFDSIDVVISKKSFNLSGTFDLGDKNPAFTLNIFTRKILYEEVKMLLPTRIAKSLSIVSLNKPINAEAKLRGPLMGGEPYILAKWVVENTNMTTPFLDFEDASFTGFFNNEVQVGQPRYDPNSIIAVKNFKAKWRGLPVSSDKIDILNLATPTLTCDLQSVFPLANLNEIIPTNSLQLTAGDAAIQLNYKGPIEKNNNSNSFLNGTIAFKNGTLLYTPRVVEMKNLNGLLLFKNSDIFIQNLECNVLNNKILMDGHAKNVLTLINKEPNKVKIDFNIFSQNLNLNAFTFLLKKRAGAIIKTSKNKNSFADMAVKIDALLEQSTMDVSLKATHLSYKKFEANNANASITLLQDRYILNNVSMQAAGGSMNMTGQILNNNPTFHTASINATVNAVEVKKLFNAFGNFGQDAVLGNNLEGVLTAKVNATIHVNDVGGVLPSTVNGSVDFILKNGALNNYEPIKKIQNFVFKKRDFDNIRFAEIKNKLEIKNGDIKINRMEIQSSVLSLFVEGVYSTKGASDLSIQIPLNNFKKRDQNYNPVNIGTKISAGKSIFLRGRTGSDGNVNFKLDIFNKFKKDKKNINP